MAISDQDATTLAIKVIRFQVESLMKLECQQQGTIFDEEKFNNCLFETLKSEVGVRMLDSLVQSIKKDQALDELSNSYI